LEWKEMSLISYKIFSYGMKNIFSCLEK
jgi:hypothetical protein